MKHILETNGISCSLIGTIQSVINGKNAESVNTTPNPLILQNLLAASEDDVIIMEVSSHALTQYRVEGVVFDFCLFTNLGHDHLDYHESMEKYFRAKTLLFDKLKDNGQAIVNIDDFWGEKLAVLLKDKGKVPYTIGQSKNSYLRILDFEGSITKIKENNELTHIHSPMFGVHNMYNVVMAFATAKLLNVDKDLISSSIPEFTGVEGRFELSQLDNGGTAVIDYAHTPDAIFHCLMTARTIWC